MSIALTLRSSKGAPLTHDEVDNNFTAIATVAAAGESGTATAVDIALFATSGTGTEVDPWVGWDTEIAWAEYTEYRFRRGWFAVDTSPNYAYAGLALVGEAGAFLKHTGTGDALYMDYGVYPRNWGVGNRIENLIIYGSWAYMTGTATADVATDQVVGTDTLFLTEIEVGQSISLGTQTYPASACESHLVVSIEDDTHLTVDAVWTLNKGGVPRVGKTRHGLYLGGLRQANLSQIFVGDVGHAAFYSHHCVTNSMRMLWTNPEPNYPTHTMNVRPQYGIWTDGGSTCWTFDNPVIEYTQAIGIWFGALSYGNVVLSGTSESNAGKGVVVDGDFNTFTGHDVEANGSDISFEVSGSHNHLYNCISDGYTYLITGNHHVIDGGGHRHLNIGAGCNGTRIMNTGGSGTIVDTGANTHKMAYGWSLSDDGGQFQTFWGNVIQKAALAGGTASAVVTDARISSVFQWTASQNFTLTNPLFPTNGQEITWIITQSGGPWTISYGSAFVMTSYAVAIGGKAFPTLNSGETTIKARYLAIDEKWHIIDFPYAASPDFITLEKPADIEWYYRPESKIQNAKVVLTFSGNLVFLGPGPRSGSRGTLLVTQGGTGSYTLTLPAGSLFAGGTPPTLSTAVGRTDKLEFVCEGSNYYWSSTLHWS